MRPLDETHSDLLELVARDFGPVENIGNQMIARNRQKWGNSGQSGYAPPSSWKNASPSEREDTEHRLIRSWMQHRARLVPSRNRFSMISNRAKNDALRFPIIYDIVDEVCNAGDVSPYLSRNIFEGKGWNSSLDPLFSAFRLCHFHLGDFFVNPKMAKGTKELLFGTISRSQFKVIGVFDHNFGAEELLNEWTKFFPDDFIQLEGMDSTNDNFTFKEIQKIARNGANVTFKVNGQVWMTKGMGVNVSGHAFRIINYYVDMRRRIDTIKNPKGPMAVFPKRIGVKYHSSGEFEIYDKELGCQYSLMKALE